VVNVLDTTNLLNTPLFAVYNSAIGVTRGIEGRYEQSSPPTTVGASFTYSLSLAGGVSDGTFLFPPPDVTDLTLQPEDHDETYVGDAYVARHFAHDLKSHIFRHPCCYRRGRPQMPPAPGQKIAPFAVVIVSSRLIVRRSRLTIDSWDDGAEATGSELIRPRYAMAAKPQNPSINRVRRNSVIIRRGGIATGDKAFRSRPRASVSILSKIR
jgi:hypothetical protein